MTTQQQIDDAVNAAIRDTAPRILVAFSSDTLLERMGYTDDSIAETLELSLENALQFGFRRELVLRPDMTVAQAVSVVARCLAEDGDFK